MEPSGSRVKAAVNAMKKLGVHKSTTRSVLSKLFKRCSNRWEPIENDNYQLLIDSIFEMHRGKVRKDVASYLFPISITRSRRGGGGRRRRTDFSGFSNLVPQTAVEILNQLVPVDEDVVPIAAVSPPQLLMTESCEQASKVGHSTGDHFEGESSASSTKGQFGSRPGKEIASLATCISGASSFGYVNVGGESGQNVEIASLAKKEVILAPARVKKVDPEDIANGKEILRIQLASGDENDIPYFHYISKNLVYKDAHVIFSLAEVGGDSCCSGCYGDCMDASMSCACERKNGGEYAYTSEGLLREDFLMSCISRKYCPQAHLDFCEICPLERVKNEINPGPCKGHLRRRFIKECWVKCGCNSQCGNRVVQRRMYPNLEVFYSGKRKGWGVRTVDELPKGDFVCEYVGEILTNKEHHERTMGATGNEQQIYPVILDSNWALKEHLKDEETLCLDATVYGNVARFINHRCYDANLVEVPVEIETPNDHYYHVAFFTTRKIKANEELNWDYGIDFGDQSHPTKAFTCHCGSRYCRDKNSSKANDMQ